MQTYSLHSVNAYCFYAFILFAAIIIIDPNVVEYALLRLKLLRINTALFCMKMRFKLFFLLHRFK